MAMAQKKTWFGSMYTFNTRGVDDFIDHFRHGYDDARADLAPFVSYESKNNVSSLFRLARLPIPRFTSSLILDSSSRAASIG